MSGDWLGLAGKTVLVTGVANKKSVAWHVGQSLQAAGTQVIYSVHSAERAAQVAPRLAPAPVLVCDVECEASIVALGEELARRGLRLDGLVHAIAYANYSGGWKAFHETSKADFLQAVDISCFSLVALTRACAPLFEPNASVVAISISDTHMAAENYGYMAPAKAALDAAVVFLAKSLAERGVRFNSVKAGPLKTASSAGIPGYLESYLYAEAATLRHRALCTDEVAASALFLLSPRSSGINATGMLVDAGMAVNFFDRELVRRAMRPEDVSCPPPKP